MAWHEGRASGHTGIDRILNSKRVGRCGCHRRPGERENRWAQLLTGPVDDAALPEPEQPAAERGGAHELTALHERLAALESEVAALREELASLRR